MLLVIRLSSFDINDAAGVPEVIWDGNRPHAFFAGSMKALGNRARRDANSK